MKRSLFAIVCSLTSLTSPASAVVINIGGFDYDITAHFTSYDNSSEALRSQPWYGNQQLAEQFASTVGLGANEPEPPGFPPSDFGPFFLIDTALPFMLTTHYDTKKVVELRGSIQDLSSIISR